MFVSRDIDVKLCHFFFTKTRICEVWYWNLSLNRAELETLEWWISGLMLDPLFFLISRLNIACFPHEFNLQIN